jgi:hypothetical protein
MKFATKFVNSLYVPTLVAAMLCVGYLLLIILAFGEPSTPLPRPLIALFLCLGFAPLLLLVAGMNIRSTKPIFPVFGAIGGALGLMACAYLHIKILLDPDPPGAGITWFDKVGFVFVLFTIPLVVFLLSLIASVTRFKKLIHQR